MNHKASTRILITGASGVIGSELLDLIAASKRNDTEILAVAHSRESAERFQKDGYSTVVWDITDRSAIAELVKNIERCDFTVVVHIAADVSWHHTYEQMAPLNVGGTIAVAELVRQTSVGSRFIYVSSAYTSPIKWDYRNAYEQTKAEAETALRNDYADLNPFVFSCSLVVGRSDTGVVNRFHGLYPLLYVLDFLRPPALVGKPEIRLDVVPVDWVVAELFAVVTSALDGAEPYDVVATAGEAAKNLGDLASDLTMSLNRCRAEVNQPDLESLPIIPPRRWHFLTKAMDSWDVDRLPRATIWTLRHIMTSYEPYLINDAILPPQNVVTSPPNLDDYLEKIVSYWFKTKSAFRTSLDEQPPTNP